jgi:hypothetical protein
MMVALLIILVLFEKHLRVEYFALEILFLAFLYIF